MADSSIANGPHPMLSAALGALDMTVESEMSLFRQHQTSAMLLESEVATEEIDELHLLSQAVADKTSSSEFLKEDASLSDCEAPNTEQGTQTPNLEFSDQMSEDLTPSELALFQVDTETETTKTAFTEGPEPQEAVLEPEEAASSDPRTVMGAPLPTDTSEEGSQLSLDPAIDDYLDSSTALRQHLEKSSAEPDPSPELSKLTVKRLAFFLGLSVLGILAIALFINITGLGKKLWSPKRSQLEQTQPPAPKTDTSRAAPSPKSSNSSPSPDIAATQGPDLSSKEFSDVNLGNLSRLKPRSSNAPSARSPSAPANPTPVASAPVAKPSEPAPVIRDQNAQAGRFYVVLPYNNAASLTQAQKIVPTAFLTEGTGGQQVQVGALETMEEAQLLAQQLRAKGLSAAIISPS